MSSSNVPVFDQPRVILYRFLDVFITCGRIKQNYMEMASQNLHPFLNEFFLHKDMLDLLDCLREQSYDERERCGCPIVFKATQPPAGIIVSYIKT